MLNWNFDEMLGSYETAILHIAHAPRDIPSSSSDKQEQQCDAMRYSLQDHFLEAHNPKRCNRIVRTFVID